ncbi:MAG: methylenetetrahydrofolate reductase C-terminal domain-containing protein [Deltaproteobacteria bacterium]|jgi:ferredoxin|nr:methylenetetrahydrofolate reductase C-terminal domain-containing protein [Deltaproteobacteria bacterium]
MIVAERKPLEEITGFVAGAKKVLVVGCRGCVTVCNAGGTKEVEILASLLRLNSQREGNPMDVDEHTMERQCDPEFAEAFGEQLGRGHDVILSMACSIGPQFLSRRYPNERIFPALNTSFLGGALASGIWSEHCQACGNCVIHEFGGLCPISRCAKSLLNGPCGGSENGRCEVSEETECVWQLIVDKMESNGRLEELSDPRLGKDWRTSRDGGPRKIAREDLIK